jgi:amidase
MKLNHFVPISLWICAVAQAAPGVFTYRANLDTVKYVYGPAPAVAHLAPGTILKTNTLDCFGDAIRKPGDSMALVKGDNPLTGPFYIDGAKPGDTLVVKILSVTPNRDYGLGSLVPFVGALHSTDYTPMLGAGVPETTWFYDIDKRANTATFVSSDKKFRVPIPLHPFLGCLGVAPPLGESRASITPGEWGGNMDTADVSAGSTVYFPVNVDGALLFLGDGHAAQGDGEVAGTGIEISMAVELQVDLRKGRKIRWPRIETPTEIMTVGACRPLDDALRIAFREMVSWLHDEHGLAELDAYQLLSQVARIRLSEMVDPNFVVVARLSKRYLPSKPVR